LCACAYGVRGINLYMAVDRDRWYGAPFDEAARERPHAQDLRQVMRALAQTQFHNLNRRVEVGLMLPKEYARLSRATHTLGAISPALLAIAGAGSTAACLNSHFGFEHAIQLEWSKYIASFAAELERAGVPYVYVESDAPRTLLDALRVVISPTYEFADPARIAALSSFTSRGGRVVCGPELPRLDDTLRPFGSQTRLDGLATWQRCAAADAPTVLQALIDELELLPPFSAEPEGVELTVHEDSNGPRVLFVLQPSAAHVQAELKLPEPLTLVDVVTGERYPAESGVLQLPLSGHSCRMFVCERSNPNAPRPRAPSARRSLPPC
jgi:beta-galactosidase